MIYINARCKQILNLLLSGSEYLTMNQIAKELKVSRRTVYYDICKINLWLEQANLPVLEVVREKGILLSHNEREKIQHLMETDTDEQIYIFSPEERVKIIICYIIFEKEAVYLEQLMDCCEVSRNTIFNNFKDVEKKLAQYDLRLEYQPKTGYEIVGNPVHIRALFILFFNELSSLFHTGTIKFLKNDEVEVYYERLKNIEKELGVNYVEGAMHSLAALVPIMYAKEKPLTLEGLKETEIAKTKEYILIDKYFPDLEQEEKIYFSLHLLGSRVNIVPDEYLESNSKQYIYDLTRFLISEFEKIACVIFEDKGQLERALFVHLNTSMYRYKYGIQIGNVLGDDVRNEYPELFTITKSATKRLEEHIGFPIPESEIAYLALHFGAFLKVSGNEKDRLRILIVCVNGISTGNMLKREVQKLMPFAEIVGVIASVNMINAQDSCDLIISTVRINTVVPVITVHPILTEFDRRSILNHKLVAPKSVLAQRERIFQVVKKYVRPEDYTYLLDDLTAFIQNNEEDPLEIHTENNLLSLLDVSRIQVIGEACSWQSSIRIASQCLLNYRSIENPYIDTIITQLQYYGPYMFLTDDVILAHARPEDGVNCLDISMAVFAEPVIYSSSRKARLVFVLAAEDQEKHLRILQDILSLISEPEYVDRVSVCKSSAEVYYLTKQLLTK